MKVWITKYALTAGIEEIDAEVCETTGTGSMIRQLAPVTRFNVYFHGDGRQWHRTKESAIARANEMRDAKIKSIKKQIAKFEAMKF